MVATTRFESGSILDTVPLSRLATHTDPKPIAIPNFLGRSNLVIGIGIGGDSSCEDMGSDLRLDTPLVRAFLGQFVTLL